MANRNAAFYGHFSLKEGFSLKITLRGWGAWIRTRGWRNQNPLPYHLATPHQQCRWTRRNILAARPLSTPWLVGDQMVAVASENTIARKNSRPKMTYGL